MDSGTVMGNSAVGIALQVAQLMQNVSKVDLGQSQEAANFLFECILEAVEVSEIIRSKPSSIRVISDRPCTNRPGLVHR